MGRERISIFDTTLRDGEQSPGCSMNLDEKVRMALQLEALGVDVLEAGFPVASEDDFEAVKAVSAAVRRPVVAALCRALPTDIERAWLAVQGAARPRLHTFLATSDLHLEHKLRKTRREALELAAAGVRFAKAFTPDIEFSAEDATRSDLDFLCDVVEAALEAGATVINIPDTVGYAVPGEFGELVRTLRARVPALDRAVLSVHCHNDLGLAVANSLAAVEAGARQVECTVNGIGERAGNASLEELVMALRVRADRLPFETGVDAAQITRASQLLTTLTGVAVQPHKAIVGRNAFAHEAGIHQHGVLQHRATYEIMTPESVGARVQSLVLGKHSGRHALQQRLKELGFALSRPELDKAYRIFIKLADQKKEIFDEDLEAIVHDGLVAIPEAWKLRAVQATAGTAATATALVTLFDGEAERTETAAGDGPVNAVCAAIDKLTGFTGRLQDFSVRPITGGADAVGEVVVHVDFGAGCATGRAASTDIVDAAARAYLNAANRLAHRRAATPAPATATA